MRCLLLIGKQLLSRTSYHQFGSIPIGFCCELSWEETTVLFEKQFRPDNLQVWQYSTYNRTLCFRKAEDSHSCCLSNGNLSSSRVCAKRPAEGKKEAHVCRAIKKKIQVGAPPLGTWLFLTAFFIKINKQIEKNKYKYYQFLHTHIVSEPSLLW